mgnify:CR=1 FL=1
MTYQVLAERGGKRYEFRIKSESKKAARLRIKKLRFDVLGVRPVEDEFAKFTR